jgi:hypothetical protein
MHDSSAPEFVLLGAIQAINANFHSGYAAEHPELVAAMVQAGAIRDLAEAVREGSGTIQSGLHAIANAIPEP